MVTLLLHLLRLLPMLCGGHRQVAPGEPCFAPPARRLQEDGEPAEVAQQRSAVLGRVVQWTGWRQALVIVSPNTVLRWQRRRFREYWARLSARPAAGRPRVSRQIRALVVRMAQAGRSLGRLGRNGSFRLASWRQRATAAITRAHELTTGVGFAHKPLLDLRACHP